LEALLSVMPVLPAHVQELHDQAVAQGCATYIDPASGYHVFTELHHQKRGYCCESGCRHCPFGYQK
jgi:hypothetical protein